MLIFCIVKYDLCVFSIIYDLKIIVWVVFVVFSLLRHFVFNYGLLYLHCSYHFDLLSTRFHKFTNSET